MKRYINSLTGEIFQATNKIKAFKYFRADGKKVGYKVHLKDIKKFN